MVLKMKKNVCSLLIILIVTNAFSEVHALKSIELNETLDYKMIEGLGIINEDFDFQASSSFDMYNEVMSILFPGYTEQTNGTLTLDRAILSFIDMLGYGVKANAGGNFGYAITAKEIGLTSGITSSGTDRLVNSDLYLLIRNALNVKPYEIYRISSESAQYRPSDLNFLNKRFSCYKIETLVIDYNITDSKFITFNINGENVKVKLNDQNLEHAAYCPLIAYIQKPSDNAINDFSNSELICFEINEKKCDVLEVNKSDINVYLPNSKLLNYYENGRIKEARVSDELTVFYNGIRPESWHFSRMTLTPSASGYIRLIDSNNDNLYDFAFVWDYESIFVDKVYEKEQIIRSKYDIHSELSAVSYGKNIDFPAISKETTVNIYKEGKLVGVSEIRPKNVLSMAVSDDHSYMAVVISDENIKGDVLHSSFETDDNFIPTASVFINDSNYKLASDYFREIKKDNFTNPIQPGTEGTFYLNIFNEIAHADFVSDKSYYGYLHMAAFDQGRLNTSIQFKLFDASGEFIVLPLAARVTIDNYFGKNPVNSLVFFGNVFYPEGNQIYAVPQLIQYKLNSNGEIKTIYTAQSGHNSSRFSLDVDYSALGRRFNAGTSQIGTGFISDDTFIINLTSPYNNERSFSIINTGSFINQKRYKTLIYDLDSNNNAGAIIVFDGGNDINQNQGLSIIDGISKAAVSDGRELKKISFYKDGNIESAFLSDSLTQIMRYNPVLTNIDDINYTESYLIPMPVSDITVGMIFQYAKNSKGEIMNMWVLSDLNNLSKETDFIAGDMEENNTFMLVYSNAKNKSDRLGVGKYVYNVTENVCVYQYSISREKTNVITSNMLEDDARILVKISNYHITDIIKLDFN